MPEMGKPAYAEMGTSDEPPPPPPPPSEEAEQLIAGAPKPKKRHSSGPSAAAPGHMAANLRRNLLPVGGSRKGQGSSEETESLYPEEEEDQPAPPPAAPKTPSQGVPVVLLRGGRHYRPLLGSDLEALPESPLVLSQTEGGARTFSPHHHDGIDVESPHLSRIAQRRMSEASYEEMDNGSAWQEEYRHRPSWCDARAALRQVQRGQAKGFKPALWVRWIMQAVLFKLGVFIQRYHYLTVIVMSVILFAWSVGLKDVTIQTDIVKLWVPTGGRLEQELNFQGKAMAQSAAEVRERTAPPSGPPLAATGGIGRRKRQAAESPPLLLVEPEMNATTTAAPLGAKKFTSGDRGESGSGGGFQVVIQTPRFDGETIMTQKDMLLHAQVLEDVARMSVTMHGQDWTLADICFKPPAPKVELGSFTEVVQFLLDKIIPCIFITPLDCFWDGAKPLGPFPPLDVPEYAKSIVPSLPTGDVSWKNLNPHEVIKDIAEVFPLGEVTTLFDRAGIKAAYQDRPCLDPLDPECPKTAPNYVDNCALVEAFVEWNRHQRVPLKITETPIPEVATLAPKSNDTDDYYEDYYDENDANGGNTDWMTSLFGGAQAARPSTLSETCRRFGDGVRKLIRARPELVNQAITDENLRPKIPDFGSVMAGGCNGFASAILNWPEEMIIGGLSHEILSDGTKKISKVEAYQSVMMVASNQDLFLRFHQRESANEKGNISGWNNVMAEEIIQAWQRNFTEMLYNYPNNTDEGTLRQLHPLASTSVGDMLTEFSKFKPTVIFIGYFLMLCYAGLCLGSWRERGVQSCAGLGIAGVLLVTFASAAGLGASTILGIEFNAATTQIVPFLTLGLGVDDMFLLVHSYQDTIRGVAHNEIGHLLKETGLSVLLTSVNNILAFSVGGFLPVPALKSFCFQTAILLFFNMICIITLFPAVISIDLQRRRSKRVDILCCIPPLKDRVLPSESKGPVITEDAESGERPPPYHLHNGSNLSKAKSASNGTAVSAHAGGNESKWSSMFENCNLEHFVSHVYGPFLEQWPVKMFVMLFFMGLLAAGAVGVSQIHLGLELTDVIPKGTAPYEFLTARERYFSFYPMFGVIRGPIDFEDHQIMIHEYQHAITQIPFIVKNQGKTGDMYWLQMMKRWLNLLQIRYDEDAQKGLINGTEINKKASDEGKLAYRLICQHNMTVDCTRNGRVRLMEEVKDSHGVDTSIIRRDAFYNYLTAWVKLDNMMYYVTQAAFVPVPPTDWGQPADKYDVLIPPAKRPKYSQIPFFVNGLTDTEATVVALRQIRAICDQYDQNGLPNFPQGIPFTFWEQYLHLVPNLLTCVGIITATVFVVISLLLMSPWSGAAIVFVLICCIVELAGFMGLCGLKLNPVSAVSLITAVGIGVEFTVHISLSFLTNMGDRNERMQATLDHMFIPVLHGGISTLLGIIMLAFSEFEFIVLYFFVVMTGLIFIGLMNGLIFLPVLLSLVGPWSEVRALDGSDSVPPPSPRTVKRQIQEGGGHQPPTELNHLSRRGTPARAAPNGARNDSLSTIEEEGDGRHHPNGRHS